MACCSLCDPYTMADESTFLSSGSAPLGAGYQDSTMSDSCAEPTMPEAQLRAYHSRCFWLGKRLCESLLAETVFEEANSSHTAMELEAEHLAAIVEFPYSDCMEKLDALKSVHIEGAGMVRMNDLVRTFMTKVGVLMSESSGDMKRRLINLIQSRGISTASVRERLAQAPPSPPSSADEALDGDKPVAIYTMKLQEWSQSKQKSIKWDPKLLSLDPSKWQMTVLIDGSEYSGVAKKQQNAKHIASKNACSDLDSDSLVFHLLTILKLKCLIQYAQIELSTLGNGRIVDYVEEELCEADDQAVRHQADSQSQLWHRFLDALCVLCQFEHAGDTVVALAARRSRKATHFVLAINNNLVQEPKAHLQDILGLLRDLFGPKARARVQIASEIRDLSITKARAKVNEYRRLFRLFVSEAEQERALVASDEEKLVLKALRSLVLSEHECSNLELCHRMNAFVKSNGYRILSDRLCEQSRAYTRARHTIGRLNSWERTSNLVTALAPQYDSIVASAQVSSVECRPDLGRTRGWPSNDNLEALVTAGCPRVARSEVLLQATVKRLESASGLLRRYQMHQQVPIVHAEAALAHYFWLKRWKFASPLPGEEDRYIGCSKPSCYSCGLYLKHHSGNFEQRPTKGRAWLRWHIPVIIEKSKSQEAESWRQREETENIRILRLMIDDMHNDVEACIFQERYGIRPDFDSTTGMRLAETLHFAKNYSFATSAEKYVTVIQRAEFFVHQSLFGHLSKALDTLVHGQMKEAKEGCGCIDDVDADTFARVVEYMYTRDYPAAEHSVLLDAASIANENQKQHKPDTNARKVGWNNGDLWRCFQDEIEPTLSSVEPFDSPIRSNDYSSSKHMATYNAMGTSTTATATATARRGQRAWQSFLSQPRMNPVRGPKPVPYTARPISEACEDYSDVFVSHAKMYVFADTYDIEELRLLSLHKLHQALACFTLYQARVADIASLLQYTYENTTERKGAIDDLRALVVSYVCCFVEMLLGDDMFKATIQAENAAGIDLFQQLRHRLD
ncbi:hypothetical protein AC579_8848 [Pseudocercospora musae]|uniref:BTB domain-containing protein n=1 Tax=Pseudocercospora musae TaxID=113226 RepID=A0A139IHC6_9PEZI|nr:hypothetical protein AC579_8848 [Pseudocercospora musae]